MKLSNFRIRDRIDIKSRSGQSQSGKSQTNHEQNNSKKDQPTIANLLESFEHILASFATFNGNKSFQQHKKAIHGPSKEIDYRDRFITIEIPQIENGKIEKKKLQAWAGQVCSESMSVAFHYLLEKKINQKQMKVFASQSFLRNLSILADNYKLTPQQIQIIDETMKQKILPYLKAKYPLTVENQVSKSLKNRVKTFDNSQLITNDYFYSSDIQFQYRENGRYDDIIMRFLNQLIRKIDQKQGESQQTNFKKFDNLMTQIFTKSFNENWMNNREQQPSQNKQDNQKQIEKYRQMVKSYTHFLINRKISQNTPNFTQEQIKSKNIQIKSPAILRIFTKWCEELWEKFDNQKYFISRTQGFLMFSSNGVGTLTPTSKEQLAKAIKIQKQKILQFLKKVQEINYQQQIHLLENQIEQSEETYIEKYEKVSGTFACKMVKNVERFIIDYLNLLIHGLINASQAAYDKWMVKYPNRWSSRYNLITFNISDLFRCKYTSKQRQIAKIFDEIQRISNENPEKLKIIRIKDRLSNVTSDIMINARFNNSMNCEIQIAVNSSKSDFMECTNKINHYIYQLQRAKFGSILQICSVWKAYEKRSEVFDKLIVKEKPRMKNIKSHEKCIQSPEQTYLTPTKDPFVCSVCSKHYYHNNYLSSHMKCKNCPFWKCVLCLIDEKYQKQDREFFFKDNKYKAQYKFCKDKKNMPGKGACILINATQMNVIQFKRIFYNFNEYLVTISGEQTVILRQITSDKHREQFFRDFLVFEFPQQIIWEEFNTNVYGFQNKIKMNLILPSQIQKCLKDKKQCISIMTEGCLGSTDLTKIFTQNRHKLQCITHLEFVYTELKNVDFLIPDFVNLNKVNVGSNELKDVTKLFQFKSIQKLDLSWNKIQQIPSSIENLKNLQQLKLYNNQIHQLPQALSTLACLQLLNISSNKLQKLPQKMGQLKDLKELYLNANKLSEFPDFLNQLQKLETLNVNNNIIQKIPQQINVSSLKSLFLSSNKLKTLPANFSNLKRLSILNLSTNQFQEIPSIIKDLSSLTNLDFSINKLTSIPNGIGRLSKLLSLNLFKNQLTSVNLCIFELSQLSSLKLGENRIEQIQDFFQKLPRLKQLTIDNNKIKNLPSSLRHCPLTTLKFTQNPFEQFQIQMLPKNQLNDVMVSKCSKFKNIVNFERFALKDQVKNILLTENNNLIEYPPFIFESNVIQKINLSFNQIKQIPNRFHEGMNILILHLRSNRLSYLPQSINSLKKIKVLNISQNVFEDFPQSICGIQSLEELHLNHNKLKIVHSNIGKLKKLKVLSISSNEIQSIPETIQQITSLQQLHAIQNKIKQIPLALCRNQSIKYLELQNNQIQKVPPQINQLKGLSNKGLTLKSNPITQIQGTQFLSTKLDNFATVCSNAKKLKAEKEAAKNPVNETQNKT